MQRVARFGPGEVSAAVKACTAELDRRVIVLSRVASPHAAAAVLASPGWELWGQDDLSRMVRQRLPPEAQDRLIDTFFRGQRQALVGRSRSSPVHG